MAAEADDEIEVIQAIYCQPGEITVSRDGSRQVIVRLKSTTEKSDDSTRSTEADLHLSLSSFYPSNAPSISVRSEQLSRSGMTQLRTMLTQAAEHSLDRPMLLDLISLASEELQKVTVCDGKMRTTDQGGGGNSATPEGRKASEQTEEINGSRESSADRMALLHLDHMRAKTQYIKLIKKWTSELFLTGRVLFCQRLILIVLQGPASAVKEYIVRQRTCNVDVDSKGHSCKERMMSVLCDIGVTLHHFRFDNFDVVEINSANDLRDFFYKYCMQDVFTDHVRTLKHFPGKN
ncbi:RWD domain-containing protein 3-like isoform X2 [Littorina saxatilis]|uniref:RWD domain-containing protein 3-like isoform X2 n=1 Tax=Littorina saxatilis TaxID=31220 RepID=UPI0038B60320